MITSFFKKSTPLNYSLIVILMLVFFFIYQFQDISWAKSFISVSEKISLLMIISASMFLTNFVVKRNGLSKDNGYTIFLYLLLILFSPSVLNNFTVLAANFFVLLAVRRLLSLQSLKSSKEKIFDASLWILIASLFEFWCILFMILVFISIIFHASRDYRNWILPVIALFTVAILFSSVALLLDFDIIIFFRNSAVIDFRINYFTNSYQNGALSIYVSIALFFVVSLLLLLSNRPLMIHSSYKKIIAYFFIGVIVFLISPNKNNDLLLFTVAPLAIMGSSRIEFSQNNLNNEIIFGVLILCSLFTFFTQL